MTKMTAVSQRGRARLFAGAGIAAVALAAFSSPAFAQDDAKCVDEDGNGVCDSQETNAEGAPISEGGIVVTGSRIARPNYDTVEPSVVISSETIEARGFETLGQALNEQPTFGVPGSSPVGGQSDFGQAQSFVNFLGLGSQRTLTLVNGRRFVSSNTSSIFGPTGAGSQVDLNVIPTKLIDRVETIAVGGAPIYGSDAIAGTINVILKSDYEGLEIDGQYGISSRGDVPNYRFRALAGTNFADGRGNIVIAGEYNKGEGLTFPDRDITSSGLFFRNASDPNSGFIRELYRDRRIPSISATGVPLVGGDAFGLDFPLDPNVQSPLIFGAPGYHFGVADAANNQLKFDANGNLIPIDFGRYAGAPGTFGIDFEGGNGFSLVPVSNLLSPTERYNAIGILNYEFSDSIRFTAEAWYSRSKGTNLVSQPVYNTGLFDAAGTPDGNVIISIDNPFLSTAARQAIVDSINNNPFSDQNYFGVNQDYFYLGRANTDLQSGLSTGTVEVMRGVIGLDGNFEMFGGKQWNWSATAIYGRSETNGRSRELIQQNFENAVDAVLDGGNIVCRPGYTSASIPSISSTCSPLNLFGTGQTQAALDYVTAWATPRSLNQQYDFTANVGGPVFALPGGDFSIAVGYEHRQESQDFDPGAFFRGELQTDGTYTSYGRSVPIQPVYGKFNTDEVYGEFLAEVISPSTGSFINLLEIKGAARYVDHSIAGGDLTWTAGGRLGFFKGMTFRGNYTQSIRAPAITEAFNPSSEYFGFATDPCDAANLGSGPAPATRAANCAAAGLPATFSSLSNSRSFKQAIAGNQDLLNEKANSWTVGVVLEPAFIPRLRISADWVDVNLKNVISQLSSSAVVANCYDSASYPNNQFCSRFTRDFTPDPTSAAYGQLDFIETGYFNSAFLRYKGVIGAMEYRVPEVFGANSGDLGLQVSYQYVDTLASKADSDPATVASQIDDSIGYSKHQAVGTINYSDEWGSLFTQVSYIGATKIDPQVPDNYYPNDYNNLPAIVFVTMGASVNVQDNFTIRLVVDNVFDQKPPYPYPATGGTITYFRGILGRYMRIGATVRF